MALFKTHLLVEIFETLTHIFNVLKGKGMIEDEEGCFLNVDNFLPALKILIIRIFQNNNEVAELQTQTFLS